MHKRMEATLQWIRNQANKNYAKTDTIPASQLLDFLTFFKDDVILLTHELMEKSLERLRAEQIVAQQALEKHLESILHEVFLELQNLAALLEKANNGELPPSNEIAELAARLAALENTVTGIRARQAVS